MDYSAYPCLCDRIGVYDAYDPEWVNVKYSDADLQTYIAKGGIVLNDKSASFEDIFVGKFQSGGVTSFFIAVETISEVCVYRFPPKMKSLRKGC